MNRWGLIDSSLEGRQRVWFPHFTAGDVPLDLDANERWRRRVQGTVNRDDRKVLKRMCREDFLFWVTGFAYLFDAGDESGKPGACPFIPYEFQVEVLTLMWYAMHEARCPMRMPKPRKIGASWMAVMLFKHCQQFMRDRHLLVGSHREEEVEGTMSVAKVDPFVGEWSKLLPKFDFLDIYQPAWMLPYRPRTEPYVSNMKRVNPETGSIIWGTSASAKAAHSERGWAVFWDEAAKTDNLYDIIGGLSEFSPCKFYTSTIGNLSHAFSTVLKDSPGILQCAPQWWMHPIYSKGMTIDPETGVRTSPWLKRKLDEIGNDPVLANQLYYADETFQEGCFYAPDTFRTIAGTTARPGTVQDPLLVGELDIIDTQDGPLVTRFCPQPNGRWKLWFNLDRNGGPPRNTRYLAGLDTAAGSNPRGPSFSTIGAADWRTGEIVADFAAKGIQPFELARIADAASKWFEGDDGKPMLLIPENVGPGAQTVDCLLRRHHHTNVWQEDPTELKYGWHKSGQGDKAKKAFGLHQEMLCDGRLVERNVDCVREMRHYQHNPSPHGAPFHSSAALAEDPADMKENHGDIVITRVCLCQALQKPYRTQAMRGMAVPRSYRAAVEAERQLEEAGELA